MKKYRILKIGTIICFSLILFLTSCDDKLPPEIDDKPSDHIFVAVNHVFGDEVLALNEKYYITENKDSIKPTTLIYHINNFILITEDDKRVLPDNKHTFFMVEGEKKLSPTFDLGILKGSFKAIEFTIGVADTTVNNTGALNSLFLDPMYWGMINGYIGFKLEGVSPSVSNTAIVLHTGGYMPPYVVSRTIRLEFDDKRLTNNVGFNTAKIELDLSKYFFDPNTIDLATTNEIHTPNEDAVRISENWDNMFAFKGLK